MKHMFDVDVAKKYGVPEAILLENMWFWIQHNKANGVHFYNGKYWTFNSIKAFTELFPYYSKDQLYRTLERLKDKGLVITGNFNKVSYDRTLWYSLTEEATEMLENAKSILQNREMEMAKSPNGNSETATPIPYINTDINKDTITLEASSPKGHVVVVRDKECMEFQNIVNFWSNNFHPIVRHEVEQLECLFQEAGYINVMEAMKVAIDNNHRSLSYVKSVADNLLNGVDFRKKKEDNKQEQPKKKTQAELDAYKRTQEMVERLKNGQ